ncbi:MAG: PhnD/SsuA/transferrin family substrate-binding protein [Pseudomonadota bacterium]
MTPTVQGAHENSSCPLINLPFPLLYDWPGMAPLREATGMALHALVDALHVRLELAPGKLRLGQPCSLPFIQTVVPQAQATGVPFTLLGAPEFNLAYVTRFVPASHRLPCKGEYCAALITHRSTQVETIGALVRPRIAINEPGSFSGHHALRAHLAASNLAPEFFPFSGEVTGSHHASLSAVANGSADLAAIDIACLAMAATHSPDLLETVQIVTLTRPVPAPPFVLLGAALDEPQAATVRADLQAVLSTTARLANGAQFIAGLRARRQEDYTAVTDLLAAADAAGMHSLVRSASRPAARHAAATSQDTDRSGETPKSI